MSEEEAEKEPVFLATRAAERIRTDEQNSSRFQWRDSKKHRNSLLLLVNSICACFAGTSRPINSSSIRARSNSSNIFATSDAVIFCIDLMVSTGSK